MIESTGYFSAFICIIKMENFNFFQNAEILVKSVPFFEGFRRKMDFLRKKNVDIFENWIHSLIL